jgi:wobble nucleotide-excising tRNase
MHLSEVNRGIIFDDPVTSLDENRKSEIALRLVQETEYKQTIIFTHDLVFVSSLIGHCNDKKTSYCCHWIENISGNPGQIWLNNSPSYEKEYRNAEPARKLYAQANKTDCAPAQREFLVKSGFTALRTCYEVLVISDLFKNVVQRFNERVSVDSLSSVYFDSELIAELQDSFAQCCRYMEGHTHSDKYAYKRPEPKNLNEEIERYEAIKNKTKRYKKA